LLSLTTRGWAQGEEGWGRMRRATHAIWLESELAPEVRHQPSSAKRKAIGKTGKGGEKHPSKRKELGVASSFQVTQKNFKKKRC